MAFQPFLKFDKIEWFFNVPKQEFYCFVGVHLHKGKQN